jgi:PleD family two-component response regulator
MNNGPVILIVDDTESNIDILVHVLGRKFDIIVVLDGQSALEMVEKEKIDLILLDIVMPKMNGYEVCAKLKANEKTKDIPIIFLTAKIDEKSIEKAYEMGGADYVKKPFIIKELLARINKELSVQKLAKELTETRLELEKLKKRTYKTSENKL